MSTSNTSIPVLFEDNHVLAVVKPVNIPSQEDNTGDPDMLTLLKADLKQRHNKPGNVFLGLVHRLDRPVGGAMVFAKTSKAASRLSETVRSRSMIKQYAAVVRGVPARTQGTLKDTLLKDSRTNTVAVVKPGTAGGKEAVLDYEVIASTGELSLVLIHLHTGRSHQIRVQMAHSGHPLYGDQKYGAEVNSKGEQLALWSVCTGIPHPVSKEMMTFVSLPPRTRPWTQWNEAVYEQIRVQLGE
ncbi:RluA family pseudouridine synthase [Paenibacillus bovis]|uniref:RNA pseudouridylate synthase n=1 Tax=Paenibacillus bovis TaxID=1616788 RepID=A0A172ZIB1_9BACL|nr:RluA family pseudouridine synthase [Paenibacillus bovis]ANF97374.1 RNA pseudouridine synthase [Paenibacillus bovis]